MDDLQRLIAWAETARPEIRALREDLSIRRHLLDDLIMVRRNSGMSQKAVAEAMGVKQPMVSQFETESSDPRLSTIQRYARAIGVDLYIEARKSAAE